MKAIILGCSHAAGAEMQKDPAKPPGHNDPSFGWHNSFPVLMAKRLGYQPLNYAISGGSNDAMFRIFVDQLPSLTSQDCVIACWTGTDRTEMYHELDKHWLHFMAGTTHFFPMAPSSYALAGHPQGGNISLASEYLQFQKQWEKYMCNYRSNFLNKLKNIQALNMIAKHNRVPVINIDCFDAVPATHGIDFAWSETFCNWAKITNQPKTEGGHYFLATHIQFADLVIQNLAENWNSV